MLHMSDVDLMRRLSARERPRGADPETLQEINAHYDEQVEGLRAVERETLEMIGGYRGPAKRHRPTAKAAAA